MANEESNNTIQLSIVTPSRLLYEGEVGYAQLPLHDGLIGILPGHSSLVGLLGFGILTMRADGEESKFVIDGGFAEVLPYKVTVLANHAQKLDEINLDDAKEALEAALKEVPVGDVAIQDNSDRINAARTRIKHAGI